VAYGIVFYRSPPLDFHNAFPKKVEFYDNVASVSALSFTDQDADAEEIGGQESRSDESSNMSLFGSRKIRDVLSYLSCSVLKRSIIT
jgi:hypothetical protein